MPQGQFLAVVGHNGSGKSTLSKHINGLLQPYEGQVLVDGMDTCKEESLLDIRRRVGMVFQNPDNQLVTTIVEEDVAFGPENLGMEPSLIRRRVDEALAAVGMSRYAQSAAHRLSGGQKQRVAIAGMLAMEPEILVLDEATAMLDPQATGTVGYGGGTAPGKGHYRSDDHPIYGRSRPGRPDAGAEPGADPAGCCSAGNI